MQWKLFDRDGTFVAQTSDSVLAGFLMGALPEGAYVKWQHRKIVFRNGKGYDGNLAAESADLAAMMMQTRRDEYLNG